MNEIFRVIDFPETINIELTNACNLRCTMCPRTTKMSRPIGMMDFNLFKKIVDEAVENKTKQIVLHVLGESMLYPHFFDAIHYIKKKDKNITVTLSTNCTLLNPEKNKKLLESELNVLLLSLDGATKQTYEKLRVNSDFDVVIPNVKDLLLQKKEKEFNSPLISIQIIYMQETKEEINSFFKIWKPFLSSNVFISVKEFNDFSGQIKVVNDNEIINNFNFMPCPLFWSRAVIFWDGTVTVCCLDTNGELAIGRIDGQSLKQIWNGENLIKMRDGILAKTYSGVEFCKPCKFGMGRLLSQFP